MKKLKAFCGKHKKLVIILGILIVLAIGITACTVSAVNKAKALLETTDETVALEKRQLVTSVSATGHVASADSRDVVVNSVQGVDIAEINVSVGDVVKEGDVIAVLDSSELELDLADAQKSLNVSKKQADLTTENSSLGLLDTQINSVKDVTRVAENLHDAQVDYDNSVADFNEAERQYNEADNAYKSHYNEGRYYELEGKILSAKEAQNKGESYDGMSGTDLDDAIAAWEDERSVMTSAKSGLESAKSRYETAANAKDAAERALRKSKESKQDAWDEGIYHIGTAENSLENSQLSQSVAGLSGEKQVRNLTAQVEDCQVKSPIAGIVTAVNYKVGDKYAGNAIVTIEDAKSYKIVADVDEYDINKIKIGQKITFKTNATGDEVLEGKVTMVAPRANAASAVTSASGASIQSNNVTYRVEMSIDSDISELRMDMTAKVTIILNEVDDVYAVPFDAIHDDEDGNTYILVKDESAPAEAQAPTVDENGAIVMPEIGRRVYVTCGAESDYYVEISSDELADGIEYYMPSNAGSSDIEDIMINAGAAGGM